MAINPEVLRFVEFVALAGYGLYERLRTRKVVQAQQAAQTKAVIEHVSEIERQVSPDPESTHPGLTVRDVVEEIRDSVANLKERVEEGEQKHAAALDERADLRRRVDTIETEVKTIKERVSALEKAA